MIVYIVTISDGSPLHKLFVPWKKLMAEFFPNKGDAPGNTRRVPHAGEAGDVTVDGALDVTGTAMLRGDVTIGGKLNLSDTTQVDMLTVTTYNFSDPFIQLNQTFSGEWLPAAGITVFRGEGMTDAALLFREMAPPSGERDPVGWFATGRDMVPRQIVTLAPTREIEALMVWNGEVGYAKTDKRISLGETEISVNMPFSIDVVTGMAGSYYRYRDVIENAFMVQYYNPETYEIQDSLDIGFRPYSDGEVVVPMPIITAKNVMLFDIRQAASTDERFVFVDVLRMSNVNNTRTILDSCNADLSLRAPHAVFLNVQIAGEWETALSAIGDCVNIGYDLDVSNGTIWGYNAELFSVSTVSMSYFTNDTYVIPNIVGWGGATTYGGLNWQVTSSEATRRSKYEVYLDITIVAGTGLEITLYAPINIGGDLANVKNIYGVARQLDGGGAIQQVYGLPPNNIAVMPPFELDPVFLTAANLVGYHLLAVKMMSTTGIWKLAITVETILEGTDIPVP